MSEINSRFRKLIRQRDEMARALAEERDRVARTETAAITGLQAQVERLRKNLERVVSAEDPWCKGEIEGVLAETPAQSVAHIEAAVYRKIQARLLGASKTCDKRYGHLGVEPVAVAAEGIFEGLAEDLDAMATRLERDA